MLRRYEPLDDLLRSQRGHRRSRRRRRVMLLLTLAVIGGAIYYTGLLRSLLEPAEPQVPAHALAIQAATEAVAHGRDAAYAPLQIEEPAVEQQLAAATIAAERTANWTEGSATKMRGELAPNESVFLALQRRGLSNGAIHEVVTATGKSFNFRKSRPGDEWRAEVDAAGVVTRFAYETSPEDVWVTTRNPDGAYETAKQEVTLDIREEAAAGTITSSLWGAFEGSGASPALAAQFLDVFAYTIDFTTETQPGDQFAVVYEKVYLDGEFLRHGKVLAAYYRGQSGEYYGIYHADESGESHGFYTPEGDNLQRQFLKSPLATTRITSRYGRRFHPVLGKMKMHAGVDYGAPTGTPVQAVADGTVTHAGWLGAAGKCVKIRHANGYETVYAHLSRIDSDVKRGRKVSKKKVIGAVGSTGRSTGPHLHFAMKHHGKHINPLEVDFARAEPLKGRERERFAKFVAEPMKERLQAVAGVAAPTAANLPAQIPSMQAE